MRFPIVCVVLSVVIGTFVEADSTTKQTTSTKATTTPALTTTTQNIKAVCAALANCGDCVDNSECIWCESSKKCEADSSLFPKECSAKHTRRFVCAFSYRTVLIVIGSLAAVIGLAITIACCCCCRRRSKLNLKNRLTRDNIRQEHEDEERRAKHAARRAERQSKYDEIRQKYDLLTEVTCLTENMKKFEKQNLPSGRSMARGDGETGVFTFAMPASDPNNHRGVSTRETSPVDETNAATLLPPPPPLVRKRNKRAAMRMPRPSLSKTHSLMMCPYHHGSLLGGSGHLSPFEARLRRRAREERRRREEREHQLELLAGMARMIAGSDDIHHHCVRCQQRASSANMLAAPGTWQHRSASSNLVTPVFFDRKECRCKKY